MRPSKYVFCLILAAAAVARAAGVDSPVVLPTNAEATAYDIAVQPDLAALTFRASVTIHLRVKEATETVVVNALDIGIDKAELGDAGLRPTVSYDVERQTATFTFPRKLAVGSYLLALEYHGVIYEKSSGLFALDYDSPSGRKRALFTQFEATDARRFVPCWDEPAQKATFNLTVTEPADLMAVSNMPVASSEVAGPGLKRVRFAETPKMSPYLLFLAVGDFERIHRDVAGVDVGVVVKRGEAEHGQYALDTACKILAYYNDYFGTPYPLPKLDLVAGPGTSQFFSAMENWGAIFYFESSILFDPKISTEDDRRNIHETIAHEMAHQWFGDLVTMRWWDNIWLNEGFASWMQEKATDHFHPEWKVWLDTLASKQYAMQTDSRDGTHPVIVPIHDILQAANSFDGITYSKGQAVIRMLEAYVGEDAFRAGVRRYMKDYAYGNTETDQLWSEIDAVSDRKLAGVAHDFTLRAGVPMVTVAEAGKGISLSQERFAYDKSGSPGGAWSIPTTIQPGTDSSPFGVLQVVDGPERTIVVAEAPPGAVVNAGQTGYFRVLYLGQAFTAMSERFGGLSPDDQIGILNDAYSIGCSGKEPLSDVLRLAVRLPADAYPSVWSTVAGRLQSLDVAYDGLPTQDAYRRFAASLMTPVLQRVEYEPKPDETANTLILRSDLLEALGRVADPAVVGWARAKFSDYRRDPTSMSGSEREAVLAIVAFNADGPSWDALHALEMKASSQLGKNQYLDLLASAHDPVIAQRALDLALTNEADPTFRPRLVTGVSRRHSLMAVSFALSHWDTLKEYIEPTVMDRYLPRLASNSYDPAVLPLLDAFAAAHIPESDNQDVRKADALVRFSSAIRTERLPEVDRWIAQYEAGGQ